MFKTYLILPIFLIGTAVQAHADWNPFNTSDKEKKEKEKADVKKAEETIQAFRKSVQDLKVFFKKAYGYAVLSTVGKGGIGIGGAYGKGIVYQKGKRIGTTSLKQVTLGFQLGGQAYSEVVFFKDKETLDAFKKGSFELGAQASAVAVKSGASSDAVYDNGVAIFTMAKGGLMYEATVSGQKFSS